MCRSLEAPGFFAGAWAPAAEDSPVYLCAYPPGSRPADEQARAALARANQQQPHRATFDVTFEVTGLHRPMADALTLTIASGNPAEKAEAKKQLLVCIQAVYQPSDVRFPPPFRPTSKRKSIF